MNLTSQFKTFLCSVFFLPLLTTAQWVQQGNDILGSNNGDFAGYSSSINGDGSIVAVGSRNANVGAGNVKVYQWDGDQWNQMGNAIEGAADYEWCGHNVALNDAGNIMAVSANGYYNSNLVSVGWVKIFEWDGSNWMQRGLTLEGDENPLGFTTFFGYGVDLNDDGSTVAIGGPNKWGINGEQNIGYVKVFDWDGANWVQRGIDLWGAENQTSFGFDVALSADGQNLAVGAPKFGPLFQETGYVSIFQWMDGAWMQMGENIEGSLGGDDSGTTVAISGNGQSVVIGAPGYVVGTENMLGDVKIFDWTGSIWTQRGETLFGIEELDTFGSSVSIASNGQRIAVGAENLTNLDPIAGSAGGNFIFDWDGNSWVQYGETIMGDESMEFSGQSELSNDGSALCIGSFGYGSGGRARVYRDAEWVGVAEKSTKKEVVCYPNPAVNTLRVEIQSGYSGGVIFNAVGQQIERIRQVSNAFNIDVSNYPEGVYLISLQGKNGVHTTRFIKTN